MRATGASRRSRSGVVLLLSITGLLGFSACTGSADPTTTSSPSVTTGTSVAPSTTAAPSTTVPVATLAPGSVGDPAVIEAARTEALRLIEIDPSSFPPGAAELEIPWPDTTNPDPVEALRSIWEFDEWVATTLPYDAFARMYLVEDSPAWRSAGEFIEQLWINGWIVVFEDPEGYVFEGGEMVELIETSAPAETLAAAPDGAVAVRYQSRSASFSVDRPGAGPVGISGSAWADLQEEAIVVPTELGWRLWWYSLAEAR